MEQELLTFPEHLNSPLDFSGVRSRSLVLCVCFVDRCLFFCTFPFGHDIVCSSSILITPFGIFKLFMIILQTKFKHNSKFVIYCQRTFMTCQERNKQKTTERPRVYNKQNNHLNWGRYYVACSVWHFFILHFKYSYFYYLYIRRELLVIVWLLKTWLSAI